MQFPNPQPRFRDHFIIRRPPSATWVNLPPCYNLSSPNPPDYSTFFVLLPSQNSFSDGTLSINKYLESIEDTQLIQFVSIVTKITIKMAQRKTPPQTYASVSHLMRKQRNEKFCSLFHRMTSSSNLMWAWYYFVLFCFTNRNSFIVFPLR